MENEQTIFSIEEIDSFISQFDDDLFVLLDFSKGNYEGESDKSREENKVIIEEQCEDSFDRVLVALSPLRSIYLKSPESIERIVKFWIVKIEETFKAFDLKGETLLDLADEFEVLYSLPWILYELKKFVPDYKFGDYLTSGNFMEQQKVLRKEFVLPEENDLTDFEIKSKKDRVRLFYELGLFDTLKKNYPYSLANNNNKISQVLSILIDEKQTTLQPYVRTLLDGVIEDKSYPENTPKIKALLSELGPK